MRINLMMQYHPDEIRRAVSRLSSLNNHPVHRAAIQTGLACTTKAGEGAIRSKKEAHKQIEELRERHHSIQCNGDLCRKYTEQYAKAEAIISRLDPQKKQEEAVVTKEPPTNGRGGRSKAKEEEKAKEKDAKEKEEKAEEANEEPVCTWHWDDLEGPHKAYATTLGYDSDTWRDDAARSLSWEQVQRDPLLQRAAQELGFTKESWAYDAVPAPLMALTKGEVDEILYAMTLSDARHAGGPVHRLSKHWYAVLRTSPTDYAQTNLGYSLVSLTTREEADGTRSFIAQCNCSQYRNVSGRRLRSERARTTDEP
jgi:hypothetical protein